MSIFSLSSVLSMAFSTLAVGYRDRQGGDEVPIVPSGRLPFASGLELDDHMLRDIGLGDGVYRRPRDDRFD